MLEPPLFSLVKLVLLLQLLRWHNLRRRRLSSDIEEIHIGLEVPLLHELDALRLSCNLLFKFKVVLSFFLEVGPTARHVLLVLGESVVQGLFPVFFNHLRFCFIQELVFFFPFRLFLHLPDFGMGVISYWSQFHILFKNLIYYKSVIS